MKHPSARLALLLTLCWFLTSGGVCASPRSAVLAAFPAGRELSATPLLLSAGADYSTSGWLGWQALVVEVSNPSGVPAGVGVRLAASATSFEWGTNVTFTASVSAGARVRWRIPLLYLSYAKWGRHWPTQPGITGFTSGGRFVPLEPRVVSLASLDPAAPVFLHSLALAEPHSVTGWVDPFGQNSTLDWPGKVHAESDLLSIDQAEVHDLKSHAADPELNEYRASKTLPALRGTGFFRVEKTGAVWWLVAPDGHLFYSQGLDCVAITASRLDSRTRPVFSWLPAPDGRFAAAWSDAHGAVKRETEPRWPSYFAANLIRKRGPDAPGSFFRERALARLLDWGFTSIGNWSDPELLSTRRVPYVTTGPETWRLWDKVTFTSPGMPDVFHSAFESSALEICKDMARYKDDAMCIGHFVENEIDWASVPGAVLGLADDAPAKLYLIKSLKARYKTVAAIDKAWGKSATRFEDLRILEDETLTPAAKSDLGRFMGEFSDRWYGTWARGIRAADPHHLLLGDRYAMAPDWDECLVSCGKHMDVVSINYYGHEIPRAEFDRYFALTGKPMLIGEYGFDSVDAGLLTAAVCVHDQAERAAGYTYYTERAASLPYLVGAHYFQYLDEPVTGRFDRETGFNGLVAVSDRPYPELVAAVRAANHRVYGIHAGTLVPGGREPKR